MSSNIQKEKPDLNKKVHELPHKPGVYLMRDRFNRVIYVGKARDLRKRVGQYFMPSRAMRADLKTRALLESVWNFEVHTVKSEPEALLLEGRLIKEFRPRYNVSFRDDKRFLLVKVEVQDAWPRFRLTRLRREDGARYFGPFAHSGALRQTMNFMRKKFGVLTFGRGSPSERELKSSTYQVPMKLSETNAEQYRERVEMACEFLSGKSQEFIGQLETEMLEAAQKLDFEKAAELRNMLDDLRKTTKPMRRFTRQDLPKTINPSADLVALQDALKLPVPPLVIECFDISNISTTHIVASMVCFKNGVPDKNSYRRYRIKTVKGQNDFASMAEVVRRRYSRVLSEVSEQLSEVRGEKAEVSIQRSEVREQLSEPNEARQLESRQISDQKEEGSEQERLGATPSLLTSDLRPLTSSLSGPSGPSGPSETTIDYSDSQESPLEIAQRVQGSPGFQFPATRIPDLIILDGGRGQLGAACKELQRLGLYDVPVMGLAKEFEEIYRPGRPMPQRLPEASGALYLLQRIRDEAHRFANGFHQLLMKRRIAESLLDDCPGVSQTRKQALLRKFGSVARIRAASADEIATVDGIGPKLAEQIREFLKKMQ